MACMNAEEIATTVRERSAGRRTLVPSSSVQDEEVCQLTRNG